MPPELIPTEPILQTLLPRGLRNFRVDRYHGDGIDWRLEDFSDEDRRILDQTYASLKQLHAILDLDEAEARQVGRIGRFVKEGDWTRVLEEMREFGRSTIRSHGGSDLARVTRVVHDLRGGAFQAIATVLQLIGMEMAEDGDARQLFFLVRDHLKMMRNAVPALDPPASAADCRAKLHSVRLLVEKWHDAEYRLGRDRKHVTVFCDYNGAISARCLEFSAVDRVFYNLINNAARSSDGDRIEVGIELAEGQPEKTIRVVIANRIYRAHRQLLETRFGTDLRELFTAGFTTGGSGIGLNICVDFVRNAFGLGTLEETILEGYVGARIVDETFVAWFHWPSAD